MATANALIHGFSLSKLTEESCKQMKELKKKGNRVHSMERNGTDIRKTDGNFYVSYMSCSALWPKMR